MPVKGLYATESSLWRDCMPQNKVCEGTVCHGIKNTGTLRYRSSELGGCALWMAVVVLCEWRWLCFVMAVVVLCGWRKRGWLNVYWVTHLLPASVYPMLLVKRLVYTGIYCVTRHCADRCLFVDSPLSDACKRCVHTVVACCCTVYVCMGVECVDNPLAGACKYIWQHAAFCCSVSVFGSYPVWISLLHLNYCCQCCRIFEYTVSISTAPHTLLLESLPVWRALQPLLVTSFDCRVLFGVSHTSLLESLSVWSAL